jgi:succinyl-CoA synthetase beta subunit
MDIHEYQAKQLLKSYGIAVPPGGVAATPDEAEAVARTLSGPDWVVKAQIHAGGRGPAGGVKLVRSVDDARAVAELMLGAPLATAQTAPQGQVVRRVYIEQGCASARALYLALLVDAASARVTLLASPERGADSIEEIAAAHPERVLKIVIDPLQGLTETAARQLAADVDFTGAQAATLVRYLQALYRAFIELDAALIELSPLVVTDSGELLALDVKMSFDDNALFRHPTLQALRVRASADPIASAAAQQGLNYLRLEGDIGTLVSGAGLALATLDAIVECGGRPANFLDIPPMSRQNQIAAAFRLLLADARLAAILVNVFGGGIMRCDAIADGIIAATRETALSVPLVVRLEGTNADIGRKTLRACAGDIRFADDLADAAAKVVQAARAAPAPKRIKKLFGKEAG